MKSIKWKILRRIGAFVLAAVLVAGGQPFCSCADEAAAEEEIGPGIIPKVNPEDLTPLVVNYSAYQDSVGWSEVKADNDPLKVQTGSFASAIRMTVSGQPEVLKGTLAYQVNIIGKGWLDWGENDVEIGAAPEQLPIEAVAMKFTDRLAEYYDIYYSVWENGAWTEWAMNGGHTSWAADCPIEAIQIRLNGVFGNSFDVYYCATLSDGTVCDWSKNGGTNGAMACGRYITGLRFSLWGKGTEGAVYKMDAQIGRASCRERVYVLV